MKITVSYDDCETLTVRLADGACGLRFDPFDDEYRSFGPSKPVELVLQESDAQELCKRLLEALLEGWSPGLVAY